MPFKSDTQGTTQVVDNDTQWTGTNRFNGGSKFVIVDQTDSTKSVIFNLSGLPTATQTEFTVPDSDSSIVTLSATQTLTNKTLTAPALNGGTWVATDSTFTIADNTTASKIARFECSGLTAGTNVFTLPNTAADTFVTLAATQTLTGKTLTAPTINAATLTGAISGGTFDTTILTAPTINAATLTGAISGGTVAPTTLTVPASTALTTPTITGGSWTRTAQVYTINAANNSKAGTDAGWVVAGANNIALVTCPASQTGSDLVVSVTGLKVGWTITGFYLIGQIESAGNHATLDADLGVLTAVAADVTDASLGSITQIDVTADTAIVAANSTKTLVSPTVILATTTYYVLISATTDAATDIALQGVAVIVTEI